MSLDDYGKDGIKALKKAGKAVLSFSLVPHPKDKYFNEKLVLADIYIVQKSTKEDSPPKTLPSECYMGTISKEEGHSCEVEVESLFGIINRFRKGKRKEAKDVWIIIEPAPEYQEQYVRNIYKHKFSSGNEYPLKVTLMPTSNNEK